MSGNGAMPIQPTFDVMVTAKMGYGDCQRVAMGWQSPKTYRVKAVPAWNQSEAEAKVLAKFGKGWQLVGGTK